MATVAELVTRAGLRSLTPDSAERVRLRPVEALYAIEPDTPVDAAAGSVAHAPSRCWSALTVPPRELAAVLASQRVLAVVVDGDDPNLPPEFVAGCRAHSLPLFVLPRAATFAQLTAALDAGAQSAASSSGGDGDVASIRRTLTDFDGQADTTSWLVLPGCVIGGTAPSDPAWALRVLGSTQVAPARRSTAATMCLSVAGPSRVLAIANPGRTALNAKRIELLGSELSAILRSIDAKRSARRGIESALIRELVEATSTAAALDPWAAALGLGVPKRVRALAVASPEEASDRDGQLTVALLDLAFQSGGSHSVGTHRGYAYALIEADPAGDDGDEFDSAVATLGELLRVQHGHRIAIGVSSTIVAGSDDLVRGLISARQLADRDARADASDSPALALPVPMAAALITEDPAKAGAMHRILLEPVIDYDRRRGTGYLTTLRTFLALDCQWNATATELGIHTNTLRYRLSRIEELTGRDLGALTDRVDYYVALCVHESAEREGRLPS
ncbi:helix-turn-helix domain-containing protein [Tsukamurella soli]|uniref:PucR C-terminal helix-turn-helix domain-containing protein n=1 Tax=Tsukamurella soli TaxID=644556 RepID=A0ABP8K4L9_9ACTN